jgi:PAS domain S-box-containing protein
MLQGLRARMIALVLVAVLPAVGVILYSTGERRQRVMKESRKETLETVHQVSNETRHMIDSARELLVLLEHLPEVQGDIATCNTLLKNLKEHNPRFANFGVIGPDGKILASAVPLPGTIDVSDRPFFQTALRTEGFQLGHFHVGRITGVPSFNFALPVRDSEGRLQRVLFAAIELASLQAFLDQLPHPKGAVVTVVDGKYTVLACHPAGSGPPPGQRLPEPLVTVLQTGRQGEAFDATGAAGTDDLVGFVTQGTSPGVLHVLADTPLDAAFAPVRSALVQDLVILGLLVLFIFLAAVIGGELFVLRRLRSISRAADRVRSGDLDVHSGIPHGPGELGNLAAAFDEMASAVRHRQEEAQRAVSTLRESEESYRLLFEGNPHPMFVYDPGTLAMLAVNEAAIRHYGYARDEFLKLTLKDLLPPEEVPPFLRLLETTPPGVPAHGLWRHRRKDGRWIQVEVTSRGLPFGGRVSRVALAHDVTERRRAEAEREAIQRVVQRLSGPIPLKEVGRVVAEESRRLFQHDAFLFSMLDEPGETILGIYAEDTAPGTTEPVEVSLAAALSGKPELVNRDVDPPGGSTIPFGFEDRLSRSLLFAPVRWEGHQIGVLSVQSYTPGRYDEKALRLLDTFASTCGGVLARMQALRALRESEDRYRTLAETASVGIWHVTPEGRTIYVNPAMCALVEIDSPAALARQTYHRYFTPESLTLIAAEEAKRPQGISSSYEVELVGQRGRRRTVSLTGAPILGPDGTLQSIIGTFIDVTERKEAQEQSHRQLERLSALRTIDMTITASMDLRLTLHTLLDQAIAQLHADAADVLRLNPQTQVLNYAAGRGFKMTAVLPSPVRLGEGIAGRAALDRRIVGIPDLAAAPSGTSLPACRTGEGFVSYVAVPLIARGLVKGVLEIYHRRPFHPDREWLDFLDAVASQAAIAIDNATLFKDLQRSSAELGVAYDTTLEGWSHALDLRDRETVGHSQRVTDVTLRLARAMNVNESELIHIRRGSLLHDIGKMGIPDNILHKPGPLSEEEWEIMKRHPVYAYKMLWPIAYLRPALDIPYCHHEKWDGTGYPRGLKNDEIPLPARMFAVVDVWDALSSNRPYRKAWPADKVRDHVRGLSGTHFDPEVVKAFLALDLSQMIREELATSVDGPTSPGPA